MLSKAIKHTQTYVYTHTNLIHNLIFVSSKDQLISEHQFIIIIVENPGLFKYVEKKEAILNSITCNFKTLGEVRENEKQQPSSYCSSFFITK